MKVVGVTAVDQARQVGAELSFLALNTEPLEEPKHLVRLTPNTFQLLEHPGLGCFLLASHVSWFSCLHLDCTPLKGRDHILYCSVSFTAPPTVLGIQQVLSKYFLVTLFVNMPCHF